jgi:hypothetical protein
MKKIILLLLICFLCPEVTSSTPSAAEWARAIFLGYDDEHYYCLIFERSQPGSYYRYTEYVKFVQYTNEGKIKKTVVLSEIQHIARNADVNNWEHQYKVKENFDVNEYIVNNRITIAFVSVWPTNYQVYFEKEGMFIGNDEKKALLINASKLNSHFNYSAYAGSEHKMIKVVGAVYSGEYLFIILQSGSNFLSLDGDTKQIVVPVSYSELSEAGKKFGYCCVP